MPHRLSRLADALHARRAAAKPARRGVNDNLAFQGTDLLVAAPEPEWRGPGTILSLGMQDGRHRLGAVRAVAQEVTGDRAADISVLLRLLEHYGAWMGFEGQPEPILGGEIRRLPTAVGDRGSVEYRLDLRQIGRDSQCLTADGTILLDGRPAAQLDGVSIVFHRTRPLVRRRTMRRARRDA